MVGLDPVTLLLSPRDPTVVRDARPFSADPGAQAVTLDWPLPQTVAGAMRTHIGNAVGFDWRGDGPARAREIAVHGPFPVARERAADAWTAYLPAPRDALTYQDDEGSLQVLRLQPDLDGSDGSGCDLPHPALRPLAVAIDAKPFAGSPFWSVEDTVAWLAEADLARPPTRTLGALPRDTRVHVGIHRQRGTAAEGLLFSTTALAFAEAAPPGSPARSATAMLCRVAGAPGDWRPVPGFMTMGAEHRLVRVTVVEEADPWPRLSAPLADALVGASRLRLQLATPAIFAHGWRPGWLDPERLEGSLPGLDAPRLRLVSAALGRRLAVSGWDLQARRPKATRYAAPSGSVLFFEVVDRPLTAGQVGHLWLRSVCDDPSDRRDGYGLALPGIW
jgi:CRISPR-associated protein Cmr3